MNYIVKIVGGKPVVFGTSGKENNGAPVYVFEEEEAFDAALAEGMIPVGSIVIKTYDAVEMAGGPFDAELSDQSENAPQNKAVKAAVDRLDQSIANALALRASLTGFGFGKICPVDTTDVTEANGIVLGGFEKNEAIIGTLANKTKEITTALNDRISYRNVLVAEGNVSEPLSNHKALIIQTRYYGSFILAKGRGALFESDCAYIQFVNEKELRIRKISIESEETRYSLSVQIFRVVAINGVASITSSQEDTSNWIIEAIYVQ